MRLDPVMAAVAPIAMLATASAAVACSCIPHESAVEHVAASDLVFRGRVLDGTRASVGTATTRFQVVEVLKGRAGRITRIRHPIDDGACGVRFRRGSTVTVLGNRATDGAMWTSLCSSARFSENEYRRAARAKAIRPPLPRAGSRRDLMQPSERTSVSAAAPEEVSPKVAIDQSNEFIRYAQRSDQIVLGRVIRANMRAPGRDGFYTSATFAIEEVLRGPSVPTGTTLNIRFPEGQDASGQWHSTAHSNIGPFGEHSLEAGQRFLLLLSRSFYEQQAAARGGTPLPGITGAGFGWHRLSGEAIGDRYVEDYPATLGEVRRLLRSAR